MLISTCHSLKEIDSLLEFWLNSHFEKKILTSLSILEDLNLLTIRGYELIIPQDFV